MECEEYLNKAAKKFKIVSTYQKQSFKFYIQIVTLSLDMWTYISLRLEDGGGYRWWSTRMLSSPLPQTHQKYIYMWNNSHRKPTGNWQKISYTQKLRERSPHNWVGQGKRSHQDGTGSSGRDTWRRRGPHQQTITLGASLPAGRSPGIIEGLEGLGLFSRGLCMCCFASSQGQERPVLVATTSLHSPVEKAQWVDLLVHTAARHWISGGQALGEDSV